MFKIFLTGKNGQIGFELHKRLTQFGVVLAPDRSDLDLSNQEKLMSVLQRFKPDLIVNAAAYTDVDGAEIDHNLPWILNVNLPETLCSYAKMNNAFIVHYSSDYVFGGKKEGCYDEDDNPSPLNVYGKTKWAGDQALVNAGVSGLILRTSWVLSARRTNFLKTIIKIGMSQTKASIVADQFGVPTTAKFLAESTMLLLGVSINNAVLKEQELRLFNLVPAGYTSWHGLATFVVSKLTDLGVAPQLKLPDIKPIKSLQYNTPAVRPLNSRLSCRKIEKYLSVEFPPWECLVENLVIEMVRDLES